MVENTTGSRCCLERSEILSLHTVKFLRALSIVAVLRCVSGCLPPDGNAPPIVIRVSQHDGLVSFEAILRDKMLSFIPNPVRLRVNTLQVKDSKGEIVWLIRSLHADINAAAQEVHYPVLPEGYRQLVPTENRAPELRSNSE